ncbi:P-loop containing nucleoside triphosphate hydrolase protein [Serendipita vermifera]|nr:P-loop containing nucleoside triphosphate hydrolase protein [Serendipita vermifera]
MSKSAPKPPPEKKIVIVGDDYVGKTSLLYSFWTSLFDVNFLPSVYEELIIEETLEGHRVRLWLCDTGIEGDYERMRHLAYQNAEMVLICYSPEVKDSLKNVEDRWAPEVYHFCPGVPIMLVGCKSDI